MTSKKTPAFNPNDCLLPETAAGFEVVNWHFGHMIHFPAMARLGHPNGRVNLKDLKPDYAGRLVDAGFPHLRRIPAGMTKAAETAQETSETGEPARKGKNKQ